MEILPRGEEGKQSVAGQPPVAASGVPVMRWAVLTTLCSAFWYKTVVAIPVRMLLNFRGQMDFLQCPQEAETVVSLLN